MGASGYAMVVCCPIYTIIGIVGGIVHKVKKRKTKKAGEQEASENTDTRGNDLSASGAEEKGRREKTEDPTSPGLKRSTSPPKATHGLKGEADNPRICDPECPGYGKDHCAVHQKSDPDRPTSPGLLAV